MSKTSLANRLRWASVVSSVGAALIGLTVLIGWATGSDPLKGSIFAGITMKANTAVCIALLGVAVALGTLGRLATARQRVAVLSCAAVVGVIAIATLSQHVFGWDLGIDQLLFHEHSGAAATQSPNRMGPVASFSLSLLALGMLVSRRPVQAGLPLFQILALCVLVIASIPVLGYLFNARQLFGIARLTGISMPTAVALQLLALGLMLSRPTVGLAGRLIAGDSGALLVRRLLPAALLIPPLLMLLRLQGERLGFYDLEFGRALLVLAFIIVFTMMVWRTGGIVSRQEADAARAERAHRDRLAHFLESMTDGFVACDPSWRVTYVNAAAERISGKSREQFVGRSCWEVLPKASPAVESEWRRAMVERVPVKLEVFDHDRGAHYEYDVFPTPDGLACYVRDVTEQVEADRRKNEFLATLAHELRNPLAPVINAMFLLRNRGGGGPESVRACEIVNRQVAHLTRLIDDLMDVARISQDKLELRKARVRLAELVAGAVEASRYLIDKQGQTLSIEFPQEPIELDADAVRLVQVLGNLLTNASRYTPERGSIALTARRDDDQLTITVADTGIGITAEQMPHIFEMFFQAERDNRRGRHGLGIGLA
ncbi:MAG TPA: PAS domain-containing sensor histidine kinase, partial [Polyangiaceae bacterium]|nr:PAS domain-containing sensor histidine kinase [Polyangiaceae bacterium]